MSKKVAVPLSGCGALDGSEPRESVLSLLAIDELGGQASCFALDQPQARVMNHHVKGKSQAALEMTESRNQLVEAARIARGDIDPLEKASPEEFDMLVMPGGTGSAYNLADFAESGAEATINPVLKSLIEGFYDAKKPIVAVCIAPAMVALAIGSRAKPTLTLGDTSYAASQNAAKLGCNMVSCGSDDCVSDQQNNVVSTPAYMHTPRLSEVRLGIKKAVEAAWQLMG